MFDFAALAAVLQPLVMVVHRDRQHALGAVLADDIIVESLENVARRGYAAILLAGDARLGFFTDDVVAQFHAFIADEHGGAGNKLAHLMLRLAAEAAVERALGIRSGKFRHYSIPDAPPREAGPIILLPQGH